MRALSLALAFSGVFALAAQASDPAVAVGKAKEEIAAGKNAEALRGLRVAIADAAALTDLKQRSAALSAIHFYSALASSNLGDEQQAAIELRSFLLYTAGAKLDPTRYPPAFVTLYDDVQKKVAHGRASPASFEDAYPGYPPTVSSSVWPVDNWGASSEFIVLGTNEEKDRWSVLRDTESRRTFIDAFWAARDSDPSTRVNEARIELLGRIAFADVAFVESFDDRGSLTDRGRVFVLLGPPQRVSIRPMNRREAWYQPRRTIDAGNAIEQWTYFRDQMPKKLPMNEVTFRFISEGGSLVRKMERDFHAEKVFKDAPAALRHE